MTFLPRRWFSYPALVWSGSTHCAWPVDSELEKRQVEKRAELVRDGRNVDRGPIDFERGLPIG